MIPLFKETYMLSIILYEAFFGIFYKKEKKSKTHEGSKSARTGKLMKLVEYYVELSYFIYQTVFN